MIPVNVLIEDVVFKDEKWVMKSERNDCSKYKNAPENFLDKKNSQPVKSWRIKVDLMVSDDYSPLYP